MNNTQVFDVLGKDIVNPATGNLDFGHPENNTSFNISFGKSGSVALADRGTLSVTEEGRPPRHISVGDDLFRVSPFVICAVNKLNGSVLFARYPRKVCK
jgi:hypothetical protein